VVDVVLQADADSLPKADRGRKAVPHGERSKIQAAERSCLAERKAEEIAQKKNWCPLGEGFLSINLARLLLHLAVLLPEFVQFLTHRPFFKKFVCSLKSDCKSKRLVIQYKCLYLHLGGCDRGD